MAVNDANDIELWEDDEGHSEEGVTHSQLRTFALDRPTYEAYYLLGTLGPRPMSNAMKLGAFVKALMFDHDEVRERFAESPFDSRRTKAYEQWEASQGERVVLTKPEVEKGQAIAEALLEDEISGPLLRAPSPAPAPISWYDPETGLLCYTRPSKLLDEDGHVIALHTTKATTDEAIARSIMKYGYATKAAWELTALSEATGEPFETLQYSLIFARTEPPHVVRVLEFAGEMLAKTAEVNRVRLLALKRAIDSGDYRNPYQKEAAIYIPEPWQFKEWQTEIRNLEVERTEQEDA